ncbi:uncharacterized protein TNCV_2896401 [Trichonephila clavipes]|nr:uncharacterized protein TNCV_2896401 [Trichonephila clavipes]
MGKYSKILIVELTTEKWRPENDEPQSIGAVGSLVVRASDSRPEGLGSMLDVTKYPPSAHGFTCRNCGGGDRGRVAIYRPFGEVSLSLNRTVTCMVLKANDRRTSCPCHDEFCGPRSDYVRQVTGDKFNKKKVGKEAEEGAPYLLVTDEQKFNVSEIKKISRTPIRSYLSDAGVSVSSKTIKSRLADITELLSWPGNSPDLNPVENLGHRLKTLVRMRYP